MVERLVRIQKVRGSIPLISMQKIRLQEFSHADVFLLYIITFFYHFYQVHCAVLGKLYEIEHFF